MSSWAREIATGYAAGSAIGQDFRENSARRRINKNLQKAQAMESQIVQLAKTDPEAAKQMETQLGGFIGEAYSSAQRLNALTGDESGSKYYDTALSQYDPYRDYAGKSKNLLRRTTDNTGLTAPEAPAPEATAPAPVDGAIAATNVDAPLQNLEPANVRGPSSPMAVSPELQGLQNERRWRERAAALGKYSPYDKLGTSEAITARAVNEIYGQIDEPAQSAMKRGSMNEAEANKIAAGISTMAIYVPQLKGAYVSVAGNETVGFSIYVDPDGEGGDEGYSINANGDPDNNISSLKQFEERVRSYRNPSAILDNRIGAEQRSIEEQKERDKEATKVWTNLIDKLPSMFDKTGLDPATLLGGIQKLDNSGWKISPAADHQESFATIPDIGEGEVLVNVRTAEDGRVLYTSRVSPDKESTGVSRTIYRDSEGNVLEGEALSSYTGADNGKFLTQFAKAQQTLSESQMSFLFDTVNTVTRAIAQGQVPQVNFETQSEKAARGNKATASPASLDLPRDSGKRDESGFPVAGRGNNIGARNNNPLNLKSVGGGFREFGNVDSGFEAATNQLMRYYEGKGVAGRPLRTVKDIISKWAPPKNDKGGIENDTARYIEDVSQWMGVDPREEIDLRDPNVMRSLLEAMAFKETGWRNPSGAPANSAQLATTPPKSAVPARPQSVANVGDDAPDESGRKMQVAGQGKGIFPMAFADGGTVAIPDDLLNLLKVD
jgi:hypothetical protein